MMAFLSAVYSIFIMLALTVVLIILAGCIGYYVISWGYRTCNDPISIYPEYRNNNVNPYKPAKVTVTTYKYEHPLAIAVTPLSPATRPFPLVKKIVPTDVTK